MNFPKASVWRFSLTAMFLSPMLSIAEVNKTDLIAPDVYFHEGDLKSHGHSNNGWIVLAHGAEPALLHSRDISGN